MVRDQKYLKSRGYIGRTQAVSIPSALRCSQSPGDQKGKSFVRTVHKADGLEIPTLKPGSTSHFRKGLAGSYQSVTLYWIVACQLGILARGDCMESCLAVITVSILTFGNDSPHGRSRLVSLSTFYHRQLKSSWISVFRLVCRSGALDKFNPRLSSVFFPLFLVEISTNF